MLRRVFPSAFPPVAIGALLAVIAACNNSPASPSRSPSFTQTDLRVGTGAEAAAGNTVTVHYTGWFYDPTKPDQKGVQFDSSAGGSPVTFTLGAGSVIPGWDQGIPGMKVGGLRRLVVPPSLAYGSARYGPIPPNTTLVFEVELLAVG
jgi:FKBP-type peptidyl-prolyl cis-trans isomerase FkpA